MDDRGEKTVFYAKSFYADWALVKRGVINAVFVLSGLILGGAVLSTGWDGSKNKLTLMLIAGMFVVIGVMRLAAIAPLWQACIELRRYPRLVLLRDGVACRTPAEEMQRIHQALSQSDATETIAEPGYLTIPWSQLDDVSVSNSAMIVQALTISGEIDVSSIANNAASADVEIETSCSYYDWQLRDKPALIADTIKSFRDNPANRAALPATCPDFRTPMRG